MAQLKTVIKIVCLMHLCFYLIYVTFDFPICPFFPQHGEQWNENACTTCICDQGEVRCHKQACPPLRCDKVFDRM